MLSTHAADAHVPRKDEIPDSENKKNSSSKHEIRHAGSWLSRLPFTSTDCNKIQVEIEANPEQQMITTVQVRLHPHVVWSSLARTDDHGFLAPCWL